eukprot:jgi/Ulvmu1/8772/UM048_0027.1
MGKSAGTVWVVVLGDFGRSPRMQYHCLSLLQLYDSKIHVFAQTNQLQGILPELLAAKAAGCLTVWPILQMPRALCALPAALDWLLKLVCVFLHLLALMVAATVCAGRPQLLLVQTPPALPVLAATALVRYAYNTPTIVDFHNVAFTLMRPLPPAGTDRTAVGTGDAVAVQAAARLERLLAPHCDGALTVSRRFQQWLQERWSVQSRVLYDTAPVFFQPVDAGQAHELFMQLRNQLLEGDPPCAPFVRDTYSATATPLTTWDGGAATWRPRPRPFLVVSSTSWTPDEDFGVLLDACILYDEACEAAAAAAAPPPLPPLVVVITGRGPLQAEWRATLAQRRLRHISFHLAWLSPEQYATLLACADVGVSLHASSSGLDLPMKVSDMLGCGLPICAVDYPAAAEQVTPGETGVVFNGASDLCRAWTRLLASDAASTGHERGHSAQHAAMAGEVRQRRQRWDTQWGAVVAPLVEGIAPRLQRQPLPR